MPSRSWACRALPLLLAPLLVLPWFGVGVAVGHEPPAAAPPAPPAALPLDASTREFDQVHLDLTVKPDLEHGTVEGTAVHDFESLVDGLETLRLHCVDTKVTAVTCPRGTPLKHELKDGILTITLPEPLKAGAAGRVSIAYVSTPRLGLLFHKPTKESPDTPWFLYSQGQGTENRRWIPCYDEPDDRLTWNVTVVAPKDLETVSNGKLEESKANPDGTHTDRWRFSWRSPMYLLTLIVADLETVTERWKDITVEYSAPPGHHDELVTALRETPHMLEVFSDLTGDPYPWPRYAQTFVWDFLYGGMENTTATTLNMRALHTEKARPNYMSEGLVAHELAHMWFGDLLTCKTWEHIWLNEGFATYMTDVWFEKRFGEETLYLRRREQNEGYMAGTPDAGALELKKEPRGDIPLELHGGKQYDRGAAILHTLRREIGDEAFWKGVKGYVAGRRDCAVTSEDLRRAMEAAAGRDLKWFWEQWVYGAGYPVLEVKYDPRSGRLELRQVQSKKGGQGLFRLSLPVRVGPNGPVQLLSVHQEKHVFHLKAGAYVRVGVGGDLLVRIKHEMAADELREILQTDPDVNARLDAVYALEAYGSPGPEHLGGALASDASYAVREEAARVLGRLQGGAEHPFVTPALVKASADADARVRETALEALGLGERSLVAETLKKAALEDPNDYCRAAAARSLGKVHADGAQELLVGLLSVDSHGDVLRAAALDGLGALGGRTAIDQAKAHLPYAWGKGGTHKLRQTALNVLVALAGDERETHALLVGLLDDHYHNMRSWAAEACGKLKVRSAVSTLKKQAESDWHGGAKAAAATALERIEPPKK